MQTCGEDLLQSHALEQYLTPCLPLNWESLLQAMADDSGCLYREKGFFQRHWAAPSFVEKMEIKITTDSQQCPKQSDEKMLLPAEN